MMLGLPDLRTGAVREIEEKARASAMGNQ
jgi:hypothetical protein